MPTTEAKIGRLLVLLLACALAAGLVLVPVRPAWAQTVLNKTASPSPATVGQPLTFTVTETNAGAANEVSFLDAFFDSATIRSVTPSQGTCTVFSPNEIFCDLGVIPAGQTATVNIVVVPTAPGSITNIVTDSEGNFDEVTVPVNSAPTPPPTPTPNPAPAPTPTPAPAATPAPASLEVAQALGDQEAESGDVSQLVEISNSGDNSNASVAAHNVANTGNAQNAQGVQQVGSDSGDVSLLGSSITVSPEFELSNEQTINQAAG